MKIHKEHSLGVSTPPPHKIRACPPPSICMWSPSSSIKPECPQFLLGFITRTILDWIIGHVIELIFSPVPSLEVGRVD